MKFPGLRTRWASRHVGGTQISLVTSRANREESLFSAAGKHQEPCENAGACVVSVLLRSYFFRGTGAPVVTTSATFNLGLPNAAKLVRYSPGSQDMPFRFLTSCRAATTAKAIGRRSMPAARFVSRTKGNALV